MLQTSKFTKKIENFTCEHCHTQVKGSGYTNHCPKCLWSKHVDDNPGDRLNKCAGLMKPVDLELKNGEYYIIHQCLKCSNKKRIKTATFDNFNEIINLIILINRPQTAPPLR